MRRQDYIVEKYLSWELPVSEELVDLTLWSYTDAVSFVPFYKFFYVIHILRKKHNEFTRFTDTLFTFLSGLKKCGFYIKNTEGNRFLTGIYYDGPYPKTRMIQKEILKNLRTAGIHGQFVSSKQKTVCLFTAFPIQDVVSKKIY
jgi:hypothetical protein